MAKRRLHDLDTEKMQQRLHDLQRYRRQSRLAHMDNRTQMAIDADYYDGIQLTPEQLEILNDREQPVQVWNVTKGVVNWALGIEEKSRVDINVLPRKKQDDRDAKSKSKLFKYNADVNYAEYMRSQAFAHAAKVGVGWLDIGAQADVNNPLSYGHIDWRDMWFDNLGKKPDLSDWRYMFMERWIDLDIANSIFDDRQKELSDAALDTNSRYPYNPEDSYIFDDATDGVSSDYGFTFGQTVEGYRNRVKIVHMQYRIPDRVKILNVKGSEYGSVDGVIYRPSDELHEHLVKYGYANLETGQRMTMRHALWCNSIFLRDFATPYNHNRFTWVPIFCYRRDRDGMPYGMIRDLRSPQDDINARKARAYYLMSSEKIFYEDGAIEGNIWEFRAEANRPDGVAKLAKGGLAKVKFVNGAADAAQQLSVGREAEQFMHNISGVTSEQQGQSKRDLSGVAIKALENQGSTTNSSLFANYYFALQLAGEIELSNIEQFMNTEQTFRITGEEQRHDFMTINHVDEQTGEMIDSITRAKSDFKISKSDYRETVRQANMETLGQLIMNLAKLGGKSGEVALAMIDVYVDLYDNLAAKDELVARIRKITGQEGVDDDLSPEEKKKKQMQTQQREETQHQTQQFQQQMAILEMKLKEAEVSGKESKAMKDKVDAITKSIEGFKKAMEAAGMVSIAPQLVTAGDTLIQEAVKAIEGTGGQQLPPAQQQPAQQQPIQQPVQPEGGMMQ